MMKAIFVLAVCAVGNFWYGGNEYAEPIVVCDGKVWSKDFSREVAPVKKIEAASIVYAEVIEPECPRCQRQRAEWLKAK